MTFSRTGPGTVLDGERRDSSKTRLWHWSDVANWFAEKLDQRVADLADAQLIAAVNASLETRNRLAALEQPGHRSAVAHIVAGGSPHPGGVL